MKLTLDVYIKAVLTAIALFLGMLVAQPLLRPVSAFAQAENAGFYIEPGTTVIRRPDGSSPGEGKIVVDLRSGDVWGFPTNLAGAPYPIATVGQPAVSKAVYLG